MLFTDTETSRMAALIQEGARQWSKGELEFAKAFGAAQKPQGYDKHIARIAQRYRGDSAPILRELAQRRFPSRAELLQPLALNRLRAVAAADSGVYRLPPDVTPLDAVAAQPLPDNDEKRSRLATVLREGRVDSLRPEIERRSIAALTLFVKPRWVRPIGAARGGRLKLDLWWGNDVACVCHPSDPGNIDLAVMFLARTAFAGVSTSDEWYSLWVRTYEDDENGAPAKFGPWRVHNVSSSGVYSIPPDDPRTLYVDNLGNPLPSPWTVVQLGEASGTIYVDPDIDMPVVLDHLSLDASAEMLARDLQAFTPVVYKGNQKQAAEVRWSPADVVQIGAGEDLVPLPLSPLLEEMRSGRQAVERELATARRNDPNAYVSEPGPPQSGVARMIQQAPHEAVLDENSLVFQAWEETQLLPAIVQVHDAFSGNPLLGPLKFSVKMRRPSQPEEPEAKQRRLQADVDAGLITSARMAVELGHYATIDDAVKTGVSNTLKAAAPVPAGLAAFGGGGFP